MKNYFIILIVCISSMAFPQDEKKILAESEAQHWEKLSQTFKVTYPGDSTIDVSYYKLDINIHQEDSTISGKVTINAVPAAGALSSFYLDFSGIMNVDSVLAGSKKLSFSRKADVLTITLDRAYSRGEKFSADVYYNGTPNSTGFGSFTFGETPNHNPSIYTLSEPYGSKDWWPCKDTPADKADSADIWITCSGSLYAVSNGTLQGVNNNSNGTKTYMWKSSYPIAPYLISMAVTNYRIYHNYFKYSQTDSMPVNHYIYPETFDAVKSNLDETVNMLAVFSDKFGLYPFIKEKYGHAQFGWGGGMEHQTVSSMGSFGIDIISHELAHQWFGDKITCRSWHDIWLNEGFATYSEAVYREAIEGKQGYKNAVSSEMRIAKNADRAVYADDISSSGTIFEDESTYSKGSMVLHMLRGIVGDSVFFTILKEYLQDPLLAYGTAETSDFQRNAERVYGQNLDYFFNEWVYQKGYPEYEISWNSQAAGAGSYLLVLNVTQLQSHLFIMPVQVKISTAAGDTVITLFNDQQIQSFNIALSSNPVAVTLDPDNWIMKDVSTVTSVSGPGTLSSFSLMQNYPNPFNPSTTIKFSVPGTQSAFMPVTLKLYDAIGNQVAVLIDKEMSAGEYEISFDASEKGLTSGIYFYELKAGKYSDVRKMVLMK